ncbi:hypothetical protein [Caulobacter sp. LARHSG274]
MNQQSDADMWRHIDSWGPAAEALGVEMIGPTEVDLGDGISVKVDVMFPQFGPKKGMLIVEDYGSLERHRHDLLAAGYGYSVFSPPPSGTYYSAEDLAEMLTDWTWNGKPQDQPKWIGTYSTRE